MDRVIDIGAIISSSASGRALEIPVYMACAVHLFKALGQVVEHVQHHVEAALRKPPPARAVGSDLRSCWLMQRMQSYKV